MNEPLQCVLDVEVKVRASENRVVGFRGPVLQVAIAAPPVDGAANQALVNLLAKRLSLPKRCVEIVGGARSRRKRVRLRGLSLEAVKRKVP